MAICFNLEALSQSTTINKTDSGTYVYSNINLGLGLLYGGYGVNAEIGKKHIAAFASFGYATEKQFDNYTIKPTFNLNGGLRYYFDVNSEVLYPRAGLVFGWVTNYYSDKIGGMSYDQSAYGLSIQAGTQFYTSNGLVVNLDITGSSKFLILKKESHPNFFNLYIRPNIGLGIDLHKILKKRKSTQLIKNKPLTPFG